MSVIIGTADFLIGDRRVSDGSGQRLLPRDKVFGNKRLVAGAVGFYASTAAVRDAVKRGAAKPGDLVHAVCDESEALCLYRGELWVVDSDSVERVRRPYHAIGSGADAALGYLAGCGSWEESACRAALKFTFTRRLDCGDGVRVTRPT